MTIDNKQDDPRYIKGLSEHDDDMTNQEWFEAMGQPERSNG